MRLVQGTELVAISGTGYRILEAVSVGSATSVYLGLNIQTSTPVGIKVISREADLRGRFESRFRREAKLLNELESPHIVEILDFGAEEEYLFFTMEHIPGRSLDQIIAQEAPMDEVDALAIIRQVVEALESTYKKGIVHRDIKPQNIRVTPEGLVKILDFGIATVVDASKITTTTGFMGTLAYVSPEQTDDPSKVDIRSDIYSTGAVLYEMLTGHVPFEAETPLQLVTHIVTRDHIPVRQYRNTIVREVEELVDKCLLKNPRYRFQIPGEMLEAIDRINIEGYKDRCAYLYAELRRVIQVRDWDAAIRLGRGLLAEDPHYRDVQELMERVHRSQQAEIRANLARLLEQARQAYESRQWDEAIRICQEILYFDPEHAEAKALLSKTQRSEGQPVVIAPSGHEFTLTKQITWIGRPHADHGVPDIDLSPETHGNTVSRRHARIQSERGQWFLVTEPKTENSSFLNDVLLQPTKVVPLHDGDKIQLGGVILQFQIKRA